MVNGTITYQEDGILTSTPSIGMNSLYRTSTVPPTYQRMGTPDISDIPHQSTFQSREDEYSDDENDIPRAAESVLAHGGTSIIESVAGSETMNIAMNRMVDSLVGPREDPSSEDDEEILFSGRKKKKEAQIRAARRGNKRPERHDGIPEAPRTRTPGPKISPLVLNKSPIAVLSPAAQLYTAKDLAAIVQNFTATHQPPQYPSHSQELPTTPTRPQHHPHYMADKNSPNNATVASTPSDWARPQNIVKSPISSSMSDPSSFFIPESVDMANTHLHQHSSPYLPYPGTVGNEWGSPHHISQEAPPNGQGSAFGSGGPSSMFSRGRD